MTFNNESIYLLLLEYILGVNINERKNGKAHIYNETTMTLTQAHTEMHTVFRVTGK